jgi:photosystem II stability/assembly factor-like uncharacterized protein
MRLTRKQALIDFIKTVAPALLAAAVFALAAVPSAQTAPQTRPQFKGIFEPINYPEDITLYDTRFVTADVGWIAGGTPTLTGGVILNTRDGGTTWTVQHGDPESSDYAVKDLRFLDEKTGWAISKDKILHTRDGESWILAGTIRDNYVDYMFTSATTGVYLGPSSDIQFTKNGGRNWEPVFKCAARVEVAGLARAVQCHWKRLQFVTPMLGFAVASSYDATDTIFLARTQDGGATWTMTTAGGAGGAEDAVFLDEKTGYVRVGYWDNGQVYKTEDAGRSWTGVAASPGLGIAFADPEVGWAFGVKKLSFTTDGGRRWNSRSIAFPANVTALSLPRRDRGYVVGEHGMIYRYRIVPVAENVPKALAAPLMPAFDSPLDDHVEKLETQIAGLEKTASAPGAADALPAAFTAQLTAIEATLAAASTETPQFTARYKNLNLLAIGVQLVTDFPAQLQGLRESLLKLKQERSLQSAATTLPELRTRVQAASQMIRTFFQKGQAR